jgi:N-acetylmuramoyl-L-alanine amidase
MKPRGRDWTPIHNFGYGRAMLVADSPVVDQLVPSPNHEPRRVARPDLVLLHYTGMASTDDAVTRLCDPATKLSSHYLVHDDGRVLQLVAEDRRAYHAGLSSWAGTTDINSRSIGIEIGNPGHDFGCPPFPDRQIAAVIALCRDIVARHGIKPADVLAHSDVAPGRKRDPGEMFPWRRLAAAGIGLWVEPSPVVAGDALRLGDSGQDVRDLQAALAEYGYGVAVTGQFDQITADVVTAFQRHFRPAKIDGRADSSTIATLRKLMAARDALVA